MTDLTTIPPLRAGPPRSAVERLLDESGTTFMACYQISPCHAVGEMRDAAAAAKVFLASAGTSASAIRAASERLADDDVARQVMLFVSAWPNASNGDLAGYGAQLLDDVLATEPCRHALDVTFRRLRRTSRFLPAIAEVLGELETHQSRMRATLFHLQRLPALVEALTAMADKRDQIDAEARARREANSR